jgi:hypothetical protein
VEREYGCVDEEERKWKWKKRRNLIGKEDGSTRTIMVKSKMFSHQANKT